jgi:hypothetical protein
MFGVGMGVDLPRFSGHRGLTEQPAVRPPQKLDRWKLEIRSVLQLGCGRFFGKLPGR